MGKKPEPFAGGSGTEKSLTKNARKKKGRKAAARLEWNVLCSNFGEILFHAVEDSRKKNQRAFSEREPPNHSEDVFFFVLKALQLLGKVPRIGLEIIILINKLLLHNFCNQNCSLFQVEIQ